MYVASFILFSYQKEAGGPNIWGEAIEQFHGFVFKVHYFTLCEAA